MECEVVGSNPPLPLPLPLSLTLTLPGGVPLHQLGRHQLRPTHTVIDLRAVALAKPGQAIPMPFVHPALNNLYVEWDSGTEREHTRCQGYW